MGPELRGPQLLQNAANGSTNASGAVARQAALSEVPFARGRDGVDRAGAGL